MSAMLVPCGCALAARPVRLRISHGRRICGSGSGSAARKARLFVLWRCWALPWKTLPITCCSSVASHSEGHLMLISCPLRRVPGDHECLDC